MRRFFACLALIILLTPGTFLRTQTDQNNIVRPDKLISTIPVSLNPLKPMEKRIGALEFLAGWELRSRNKNFGGISSMIILPGPQVLALSDGAYLFSFGLRQTTNRSAGAPRDFIAPLPNFGEFEEDRETRDSESFVRDPVNGRYWVGFEVTNGIARYDPGLTRREVFRVPQQMHDWPGNSGPEAMILLGTGAFLVFSEDEEKGNGLTDAILFRGDPLDPKTRWFRFSYRPPKGYSITDAAQLPDGRLLILNRRFAVLEGVSARLTLADPAKIVAGGVLEAKVIAEIDPPLTVDNMEALAVTEEKGQTMVWLASDNNFSSIQRSLLMKFRLRLEKIDKAEDINPGLSSVRD